VNRKPNLSGKKKAGGGFSFDPPKLREEVEGRGSEWGCLTDTTRPREGQPKKRHGVQPVPRKKKGGGKPSVVQKGFIKKESDAELKKKRGTNLH